MKSAFLGMDFMGFFTVINTDCSDFFIQQVQVQHHFGLKPHTL